MTTWQDQEPLSRRALRESERARAQATVSAVDQVEETENASDQQIWSENSIAEPLGYTTQVRQPTVEPEAPLLRPRQPGAQRAASESAGYRFREFGPESRGNSFSATQPAPWTPPSSGSEDLSYHTSIEANEAPKTAFSEPVAAPPIVVTPVEASSGNFAPTDPPSDGLEEHTLTRRELRERRNAASLPAEPVEAPAQLPPDRRPTQNAELDAAMQEFDAKFQAEAIPALVEPPTKYAPVAPPPVAEVPVAPAPVAQVPVAPAPVFDAPAPPVVVAPVADPTPVAPVAAAPAPVLPAPVAPVAAPAPAAPAPAQPVSSEPSPNFPPPAANVAPAAAVAPPPAPAAEPIAEPLREVISAPEVYAAPPGHWSNQAEAQDQSHGSSGPHKRDLSASDAITTSALVMPNFSATGPTTGPVSGTGQVLMTGSIELPRSLGISGLHPSRYDRSDIDAIIDAGDREDAAPDSAPVRAVRAVSTYTSSQGIIATKRPRESNLPMVLSITAGVMMVGVVVLVVAGMIFKIF